MVLRQAGWGRSLPSCPAKLLVGLKFLAKFGLSDSFDPANDFGLCSTGRLAVERRFDRFKSFVNIDFRYRESIYSRILTTWVAIPFLTAAEVVLSLDLVNVKIDKRHMLGEASLPGMESGF